MNIATSRHRKIETHRHIQHRNITTFRAANVSYGSVDPALFAAYVSFAAILVVTPGSTTAVVVRNTLSGGRAGGLAAAGGAAVANTSHAIAAGLGLAVIVARWPGALIGLRVAGAVYLAWLGARGLYRVAAYPDGGLRIMNGGAGTTDAIRRGGFRQGLAVNLLNPAIATFYLVVVPSFIPAAAPRRYFAILAVLHIAMAFTCHSAWVMALDTLRRSLATPTSRRLLEAATGIALIALAARVLLG